jgi:hypothetical protein
MKYYLHKLRYGPVFRIKKHLFDIKFHTLEQYNNFEKSKFNKTLRWLGLYTHNYNSPIGVELFLSSTKDFDEQYLNNNLNHLKTICRLHLFQKAKSYGSRIGVLLGILVTHEDYYYVLMDEYGYRWYITCCAKLEFIKD